MDVELGEELVVGPKLIGKGWISLESHCPSLFLRPLQGQLCLQVVCPSLLKELPSVLLAVHFSICFVLSV